MPMDCEQESYLPTAFIAINPRVRTPIEAAIDGQIGFLDELGSDLDLEDSHEDGNLAGSLSDREKEPAEWGIAN